MTELWLKFKDGNGEDQRVLVDDEKFTIGRHSSNNLSIPNGKLSREHVKIDRFDDIFVIYDSGSSNGTQVNGEELKNPVALKQGDRLDLGGGLDMEVEFVSDDPNAGRPHVDAEDGNEDEESSGEASGAVSGHSSTVASSGGDSGIPTSIFYIAPVLGLIILVFIGVLIYAFSGNGTPEPGNKDDFVYTKNKDKDTDPPVNKKDRDPASNGLKTDKTPGDQSTNNNISTSDDPNAAPTPKDTSDAGKSEQNGAAFLRRIAQNDPKAFLTGEQAQLVNGKIKQLSGSSALADNISSARRNSAQIRALATQKNLKPQFLATAALTKLGNSKGDSLQAAQDMAETLDKLGTQIGSELANDCLLMIAAYDQGSAGDFMKMRNMLQDLATKSPESSRAIRTIWFLHKNGKITDGEFDFALRFLAIGTITQNPKDFGVNAEALVL